MKKNFKLKVKLMKSQGWCYNEKHLLPHFRKWIKKDSYHREIDAQAVNIMTFDQLSRFLGY